MKIRPTARNRQLLFFVRDLDAVTSERRDLPELRVGRARAVDYLLSMLPGQPRLSLMRRVRRGDRYFTVCDGWRIVAVGRICFVDTPEVELGPGEAALISLYTRPAYRGRGLYPRLLMEQLQFLRESGYARACIWADRANESSLRGIRKAGFTPFEA